jgi:ribonucleoside-diphosphate reductase beta chain
MSLIKQHGLPVYKPKDGFKYPWAIDFFERHDSMVWHKTEYDLTKDVQDYAKADEREKKDIDNIMGLFTQNDVEAETGYETMLRIFKPTEVKLMLGSFLAREGTHFFNYANFAETIGLPDSSFTDFLDVPVMSTKIEYLEKAKVKKYEDYKAMGLSDAEVDREFRRAVARMLAVYAGGL